MWFEQLLIPVPYRAGLGLRKALLEESVPFAAGDRQQLVSDLHSFDSQSKTKWAEGSEEGEHDWVLESQSFGSFRQWDPSFDFN